MSCSYYFTALGNDILLCTLQDDRMKTSGAHLDCSNLYLSLKEKLEFINQEQKKALFQWCYVVEFWCLKLRYYLQSEYYILISYIIIHFLCEKTNIYVFIYCKLEGLFRLPKLRNNFTEELHFENVSLAGLEILTRLVLVNRL